MLIALDLDEVLSETLPEIIKYYNNKYKTSFKKEDFHTCNYWEVWGGTKEETVEEVYKFLRSPYFKNIKLKPGAVEAINILKQNHKLIIITNRPDYAKKETEDWISKHFPNKFSKIYFTNYFSKNQKKKDKFEICSELGVDILIEDTADCAIKCADNGTKVLLFDYPWNKEVKDSDKIQRVYSWQEAIEKINFMAKSQP